jgi:cell division protein FtsB
MNMASSTAAGNRKEHTPDARPPRLSKERGTAGPISFFIAMIIVILASIELVSTFHTYAMNLSQLNSLRKQEASLIAQKQELENNINRWNDDAYVTAQARDRLGFVFAGEQAIRVLHPEAVTGTEAANNGGNSGKDSKEDKPGIRRWHRRSKKPIRATARSMPRKTIRAPQAVTETTANSRRLSGAAGFARSYGMGF